MNLDPGAETARQNNFIHTLDYDLGSAPDPHGRLPAPSSSSFMNYHSQPPQMANMQLSMDTFQGLLNAAENAGQQGSSPQVQATPQALLEQQMRLQQLQQLQQLQNQIFQQQVSSSLINDRRRIASDGGGTKHVGSRKLDSNIRGRRPMRLIAKAHRLLTTSMF